jgi:hypothetical protein
MKARHERNRAFALALAVALMGFVAAFLGVLALLAQAEIAGTARRQRQVQSRQNALLALDLAMAQLQKYAGPDRRITAADTARTSRNFHFTGVWDNQSRGIAPLTWLVSGNEHADGLTITPSTELPEAVELIGVGTSGVPNDVRAPRQSVHGMDEHDPDQAVGGYAWWVGDEGVKGSVAPVDRSSAINYRPYDSAELRSRLRQQITAGGRPDEFDFRAEANARLIGNLIAYAQLAFLQTSDGGPVGIAPVKRNFHDWTLNHLAVLADTTRGGLRQDLSLKPGLLGEAFAQWANYPAYMEDPAAAHKTSPPLPAITSIEAIRRRYRITPPKSDGGLLSGVAPVLVLGLLNFDSRTLNGAAGVATVESRLRWIVGLWNPYSSALVPEDLRIEIDGLPAALDFAQSAQGPALASISLAAMFGSPLRLVLPWDAARADLVGQPDASSWLPGRVYYWTSLGNANEPPSGNAGYFYSKSLIGSPSRVVSRLSTSTISGNTMGGWRVNRATTLTVRLYRSSDGALLATYSSPAFAPFFATDPVTTPRASSGAYEFSFFFRLDQNRPAGEAIWLSNHDPRSPTLSADAFVSGSQGPFPNAYPGVPAITNDDLLLERSMADYGQSYNEDVPVFELPRAPLLSIGDLQHLQVSGRRPFAIGNPWGADRGWNRLFDRYFFSGLTDVVELPDFSAGQPLPNAMLVVAPWRFSRVPLTAAELRAEAAADRQGLSSKYLLQSGAFNLNSTSREAWAILLRGIRFQEGSDPSYLDASQMTGTAADAAIQRLRTDMPAAIFRFPQSAAETLKAEPGRAGGLATSSNPSPSTVANTDLFRRGLRVLSDVNVSDLAAALATRVAARRESAGPFRSVEEFLNEGILEVAIADAHLNDAIPEFSSQWLTAGDVMSGLAPVLFARSDTFLIRAYGDTANRATGAIENRAWCEAAVQRAPEPFAPATRSNITDAEYQAPPGPDGRRFKIVSFRWLTAADI